MTIARLRAEDLDAVMQIERQSFRSPWRRSFFLADLNRPESLLLAAHLGTDLVGYLVAWRVADELHLANIAVAQPFRRQGVATQLLHSVLEFGQQTACREIYLEVRPSNLPAIRFYEKEGFRYCYTRSRYYPDGEDALVYRRMLDRVTPCPARPSTAPAQ
ncbi:MAG: ribosomal protein S18-alanine N-acetyltransferase [candidate division WOR-3 bacterium]